MTHRARFAAHERGYGVRRGARHTARRRAARLGRRGREGRRPRPRPDRHAKLRVMPGVDDERASLTRVMVSRHQ